MNGTDHKLRPIWINAHSGQVQIIDQRRLPHEMVICDLDTTDALIHAICDMAVRGAPLIGVTGAYGVYLAAREALDANDPPTAFQQRLERIRAARPTAVNLAWSVDHLRARLPRETVTPRTVAEALRLAGDIAEQEAANCRRIGEHGLHLIKAAAEKKGGGTVNILTHCNAGWLACIAYGTATAPIYVAAEQGIDVHVWVDETRPLNQGARLTAWELARQGIAHTIVTDNAGGHLMQRGLVDMVLVGTDRTTWAGDVANKIGTYLKALAARDNALPFYVALPSSTFDWHLRDGRDIPIEERDPDEVRFVYGRSGNNTIPVLVPPADSPAANPAFDITPARLVTAFITERGVCGATVEGIAGLFPDR